MRLQEIYRRYQDRVEFFNVYIKEAHPSDDGITKRNELDGVIIAQPTTVAEREQVAEACMLHLDLSIPTLIDIMDDVTEQAYAALPDRLYLIGTDGRVAYKSEPGPRGFEPEEFEQAIREYLG